MIYSMCFADPTIMPVQTVENELAITGYLWAVSDRSDRQGTVKT